MAEIIESAATGADAAAPPAIVTLSDSAVRRIKVLREKEGNDALMLRLTVSGGGCSGFQYHFDLTDARNDDDIAIERDGVTVLVDDMSLEYMAGSEIDYVDELIGASFQVRNPNATASCGCGTSFSI